MAGSSGCGQWQQCQYQRHGWQRWARPSRERDPPGGGENLHEDDADLAAQGLASGPITRLASFIHTCMYARVRPEEIQAKQEQVAATPQHNQGSEKREVKNDGRDYDVRNNRKTCKRKLGIYKNFS